jgi:type IV pilus assembly protein PilY1
MRAVFLLVVLVSLPCLADEDEAWLHRADVPAGTRPLLALLLDRSAATAEFVEATAAFDAGVDYGAGLAVALRCGAANTYWRRGPGAAPDCHDESTVAVLACESAQAPLAAYGYFVAPPGIANECFADGAAPRVDAHIFYSGNYLNYLHSRPTSVGQPLATLLADRLADALAATAGLDVALLVTDDDGPAGGYVAFAPVANDVAAERVRAQAATAPAGDSALAETLAEAAGWLRGDAVQSGIDVRADPGAQDPPGSGRYRSPFDTACRPVSLAVLAPSGISSEDETFVMEIGTTDLRTDLPGTQSAPITWLTPAAGFSPSDPLAGPNLVASAFQHDAAIAAAPQLSAAGFVPSEDESRNPGVILGLTAPRARARWPGNLFRYGLRTPTSPLEAPLVVDRDGDPAIDPASGLPYPHTRSLWSDSPDANLLAGGAAGRLPSPDARRLYSNVVGDRLLDAGNALAPGPLHVERTLGDPGRHAPVVIDDEATGRVFALAATQDGTLHAFDAESGVEQWAWIPRELLSRLAGLTSDAPSITRSHGIDGALVLHRQEGSDPHRWLLFGLGRGGARYYALDLAWPDDPRLLWSFALPDTRVQARGEPVVTRLRIAGSGQSAGDWIVLLPGGYDTRFDAPEASGTGAVGALHIVDAATGRVLWSRDGFTSLPSAPRALDLDGDGHLDRAYVIDVTGNLWRLDFTNGATAAELAAAQRLARLGTGAHRFFATPDVAVTEVAGVAHLAIAVGSGTLTRPRDASLVDRVYVLFDALAGTAPAEVDEDALFDATDAADALPPDARGWFVRLEAHGAGEKVIGPTVTFDHVLRFQTYQPLPPDAAAPCGPPRAAARRYALDLRTALPRNTAAESEEDGPEEVTASGLPPELRFGFDARWQEPCAGCRPRPFGITGGETFDPGYAGDPVRTSWRKLAPPPASP